MGPWNAADDTLDHESLERLGWSGEVEVWRKALGS
jgi:hypothetical protein